MIDVTMTDDIKALIPHVRKLLSIDGTGGYLVSIQNLAKELVVTNADVLGFYQTSLFCLVCDIFDIQFLAGFSGYS